VASVNTVTGWPSARPRRSAEARVMAETICWPLTWLARYDDGPHNGMPLEMWAPACCPVLLS
jgi:hypothetical protein